MICSLWLPIKPIVRLWRENQQVPIALKRYRVPIALKRYRVPIALKRAIRSPKTPPLHSPARKIPPSDRADRSE